MSEYSSQPGIFTVYDMQPKDELLGQQLNVNQRMVLHNLRAIKVEAKLNLRFTPENINKYLQDEAYLVGQIELLDALLEPVDVPDDSQPT